MDDTKRRIVAWVQAAIVDNVKTELTDLGEIEVKPVPGSAQQLQIRVKTPTQGTRYFTVKVAEIL